MIKVDHVFAVDGHDGTGKTTLARWLAEQVGGSYQRPFSGELGAALLDAAERGDDARVLAIGEKGITNAIAAAADRQPIILDRSWMTVASLVNWAVFSSTWQQWIPTVLCWADLETTLARLSQRSEKTETLDWHRHYLRVYQALAERTGSRILRTDINSLEQCQSILLDCFKTIVTEESTCN